ncbi:MAG: hypothetical protein GY856_36780 [bacterium]|nr:hypothetical protein [bacterium]
MQIPTVTVKKGKQAIVVNACDVKRWQAQGFQAATDPTRTRASKPIVIKDPPPSGESEGED